MRMIVLVTLCISLCLTNLACGAATVFFKDGTKEVGNSAWIEGSTVYLSKANQVYEYSAAEVNMEETQKRSKIGPYAEKSLPDTRTGSVAVGASAELVEQLINSSNIDLQIDQFIQQFGAGTLSSVADNQELQEIFRQGLAGFDSRKVKLKIRAYYRSHLDDTTVGTMLAWAKSPLGMKVIEMETRMSETTPEIAQQIAVDLEENPPSAQRLALIKELDQAGRITEMTLQLVTDAFTGAMGAVPAKTADQKKVRTEIRKHMNEQKVQVGPLLRKQVQAALITTYKDLEDDELSQYVSFMQTEPARKFTKATMGAMSEMTKDLSATIIRNIAKAAQQKARGQGE